MQTQTTQTIERYKSLSAYDVLMSASESELAEIFFTYGQERAAKKIAHTIVIKRNNDALPQTTIEFASMIQSLMSLPKTPRPAMRWLETLRIAATTLFNKIARR